MRRGRDYKFASFHQCWCRGTVGLFELFVCNLFVVLCWVRVEVKVCNCSCVSGEVNLCVFVGQFLLVFFLFGAGQRGS